MIDRIKASKWVGWRVQQVQMPDVESAKQLVLGIANGEQDAYEEVLRIRRFATSEQWNSPIGRIIQVAFILSINNIDNKHIHV
jgi:hypothetical protein